MNKDLAFSYIRKAKVRSKLIQLAFELEGYSDVVHDAQALVELCVKGMLLYEGINVPKYHEVSRLLMEHQDKFPEIVRSSFPKIIKISKTLRRNRELSFYGDDDFIPTDEYSQEEALETIENAKFVLQIAESVIKA
jgi:HEPN domain-containing protein